MHACEYCDREYADWSSLCEHLQVCRSRLRLEEQQQAMEQMEQLYRQETEQLMRILRETEHVPSDGYRLLNIKMKILHEEIQKVIRQNQFLALQLNLSPS